MSKFQKKGWLQLRNNHEGHVSEWHKMIYKHIKAFLTFKYFKYSDLEDNRADFFISSRFQHGQQEIIYSFKKGQQRHLSISWWGRHLNVVYCLRSRVARQPSSHTYQKHIQTYETGKTDTSSFSTVAGGKHPISQFHRYKPEFYFFLAHSALGKLYFRRLRQKHLAEIRQEHNPR